MPSLFEDPVALGLTIKRLRRSAGVSQTALGDATGTSKSTVVRWESGDEGAKGRTPQARRSIAAAVAEALQVPRSELGLGLSSPNGDELAARVAKIEERQMTGAPLLDELRSEQEQLAKRLKQVERSLERIERAMRDAPNTKPRR